LFSIVGTLDKKFEIFVEKFITLGYTIEKMLKSKISIHPIDMSHIFLSKFKI